MLAVKHSPKVANILAKGQDITVSDLTYLIDRDVDLKTITEFTGLGKSEINYTRKHLVRPKKRKYTRQPKTELTVKRFKQLLSEKVTKKEIAEMHGMNVSSLRVWEISNGFVTPDMKGLTVDKFKEYKKAGITDDEIRKKYKISLETLGGWKNFNFGDGDAFNLPRIPGR